MDKNVSKKRERDSGNAGRCSKVRSKRNYAKKRKYHGKGKKANNEENVGDNISSQDNNTQLVELAAETTNITTASSSKIIDIPVEDTATSSSTKGLLYQQTVVPPSGYRLIDISILANIFRVVCCPECKDTKTLQLSDINDEKKGLARLLKLQCTSCLYTKTFFTAKQLGTSEKGGRKSFDVNVRTGYASRQIGAGYEQIKKFCSYLNMPSPMLSNNYTKISDKLRVSAKKVAEKSMAAAASELRGEAPTADVGVSVDGTWQRKGYSSMNGVITAISVDNGKVLDTAILTKNCKACVRMRSAEPETYQAWYEKHQSDCSLNHEGSSPAMETAGAKKMFEASVENHNLYYTSFYGDGDSKAYPAVKDVYGPEKPVTKYECIGHYQKRVGTRMRKLKKNTKGLGGRGRLTDTIIDKMQNYFGIVLRQNCGDLNKMVMACKASMYHVAGYHDSCPKDPDTWCQYQLDKVNNTNVHNEKNCLPLAVRQAILPFTWICASRKIWRSVFMAAHKMLTRVLTAWYGTVFQSPIMWALVF